MATALRQWKPRYTPEEYLTLERAAEFRSEYLAGEIVATAGASLQHNRITTNVNWSLSTQLADRPCDSFATDMRVRVDAPNVHYTYPDVVALCEEPLFNDEHEDGLVNPSVLVEVLSRSTQGYDREGKFALYRRIERLTDYVVIAQNEVRVEHHVKHNPFQWLLTEYTNLEDRLSLASIGCTLSLADIYHKVEFPSAQDGQAIVSHQEARRDRR